MWCECDSKLNIKFGAKRCTNLLKKILNFLLNQNDKDIEKLYILSCVVIIDRNKRERRLYNLRHGTCTLRFFFWLTVFYFILFFNFDFSSFFKKKLIYNEISASTSFFSY